MAYALSSGTSNTGNLRETFFVSQAAVRYNVNYAKKGDFYIDNKYTFEIGGKNKTGKQIQGIKNSFIAADDIDYPVTVLPLCLFGFLY